MTRATGPTTEAVRRIWERHRATIMGQVDAVAGAVEALGSGGLEPQARADARRDAHKLAGSLGTFGFPGASERARTLELWLGGELRDVGAVELATLVAELRDELDEPEGDGVDHEATAPTAGEGDGGPDGTPLVLLVEDDRALRDRLATEAARRGLRTRAVDSPADARAAARLERPSLVLLDLTFDGRTEAAYDLLAELATQDPPVPVLVFTVRDVFTDRVEVARRGGRGFVPKSLPPQQVMDHVEQLIERGRATETKLLAVDDDHAILDAVRGYLEPEGLRVKTLDEPRRFWDELERTSPDMILLDVDMPEINGIELCRVIRNDPRWASLPVLFLTSRRDERSLRDIFDAGADDYLQKPVIGAELVGRVRNRLERYQLHRYLAERDALTGVRNRQTATQAIERLLALCERFDQPLTLAALDLDRFKDVNDRHGHAAGDAVLRKLGERLLGAFRGEDVVGRWGGEEFVVAMYGMPCADGLRRLREVLATFARDEYPDADGEPFRVTFSGGVAVYPDDGRDLATLHRAADAALYAAKEAGRSQVQSARSVRAAGAR